MAKKVEGPKLPPPVNVGGGSKIVVKVSGRMRLTSSDAKVVIERND